MSRIVLLVPTGTDLHYEHAISPSNNDLERPFASDARNRFDTGKGEITITNKQSDQRQTIESAGISRREFLALGAAVAAGLALPGRGAAGTTAMPLAQSTRRLGNLEVSGLGLGCMNACFGFGPDIEKKDAIDLFRYAYEQGVRFFDTAEAYGPYVSEEWVGDALAPVRHEVVIASKFGFDLSPEGRIQGPALSRCHFTP